MALEKGPDGIFSVWCLLLNHEMNFEIYIVAVIWIFPVYSQDKAKLAQFLKKRLH